MKKIIAAVLLLAMSATVCACDIDKKDDVEVFWESDTSESYVKEDAPEYVDERMVAYFEALEYLDAGEIQDAYDIFLTIKGYRDVDEYLEKFSFKPSVVIGRSPTAAFIEHYYEYDEYGKILFESYGSSSFYSYEYDDRENLIKVVYRKGDREEITTYEYDENGRAVLQTNPDGSFTRLEYDEKGNIIRSTRASGYGEENTYDEYGNCLTKVYTFDDVAYYRIVFEYNSDGKCVKEIREYDLDVATATPSSTVITREYDENGNVTTELYKWSSGGYDKYEYEYDENGNKITYRHGNTVSRYKYDEVGNLIEYSRTDSSLDERYLYEYDDKGNCVKITSYWGRYSDIAEFEYDNYGNLLKEIRGGETDSPDDYYIATYLGYKLYYNSIPEKEMPEQLDGKG